MSAPLALRYPHYGGKDYPCLGKPEVIDVRGCQERPEFCCVLRNSDVVGKHRNPVHQQRQKCPDCYHLFLIHCLIIFEVSKSCNTLFAATGLRHFEYYKAMNKN